MCNSLICYLAAGTLTDCSHDKSTEAFHISCSFSSHPVVNFISAHPTAVGYDFVSLWKIFWKKNCGVRGTPSTQIASSIF